MNKKNFWAFMFIAGIVIGGSAWAISEAPFLDDKMKYSDQAFKQIQAMCTTGMILGGLLIAAGLGVGYTTQWGKHK